MSNDATWSDGLDRLPGLRYQVPHTVKRPRLAAAHAVPRVSEHDFDGERHVYLLWDTEDGSMSGSPSSRYFGERPTVDTTGAALAHLHSGLSLPGTPSDYHFAIQHAIDAVWKRRHLDAEAAQVTETLCLLDLDLVEAYPEPFRTGDHFYSITAVYLLPELYEGAGDVDAALAAARRVKPFRNGSGDVERLEEKLRVLNEEDQP